MTVIPVSLFVICAVIGHISGHGYIVDPPNRSSIWRVDPSAPENDEDDTLWCGGVGIQWGKLEGKCGICGDPYDDPHPQPNENTGTYGQGKVVKTYTPGSVIDVQINITFNHMGDWNYTLCVLEDPDAPEPGEECFKDLEFASGQTKYSIDTTDSKFVVTNQVKLPDDVTCERCVLRWHYQTADIVGLCQDGSFGLGCVSQETFRSCSDIAILKD